MADRGTQPLDPLVDHVLESIADQLTAGLSHEQAEWALAAFRHTILPHRLRFAAEEQEQQQQSRAQVVIEDLTEDFQGLGPEQRWGEVLGRYYLARLMPLGDAALALAEQRHRGERPDDELRSEAEQTRAQIEALVSEIEADAPEVAENLEVMISEALTDCETAMGASEALSLGMKHVIEAGEPEEDIPELEEQDCPSCGARIAAASRFCPECGKPLECPSCGAGVEPGNRFCTTCGARLAGQEG